MIHKDRMTLIEATVHELLKPLGFIKQKLNWRRTLPELLQQFSIVSMQLGERFQPQWGINVMSLSEDPRPLAHKLHINWDVQSIVIPLASSLEFMEAFDLGAVLDNESRVNCVRALFRQEVIPTFNSFTNESQVRAVARAYEFQDRPIQITAEEAAASRAKAPHPWQPTGIGGLPRSWWPPKWATDPEEDR